MLHDDGGLVGRQQGLVARIMGQQVLDVAHIHPHRRLTDAHLRRQLLFIHCLHDAWVYDTHTFYRSLHESTLHFFYLMTLAFVRLAR